MPFDLHIRFNTLLDSGKTGLRLKPSVFEKNHACFGRPVPGFKDLSASNVKGDKLLQAYDQVTMMTDKIGSL